MGEGQEGERILKEGRESDQLERGLLSRKPNKKEDLSGFLNHYSPPVTPTQFIEKQAE